MQSWGLLLPYPRDSFWPFHVFGFQFYLSCVFLFCMYYQFWQHTSSYCYMRNGAWQVKFFESLYISLLGRPWQSTTNWVVWPTKMCYLTVLEAEIPKLKSQKIWFLLRVVKEKRFHRAFETSGGLTMPSQCQSLTFFGL